MNFPRISHVYDKPACDNVVIQLTHKFSHRSAKQLDMIFGAMTSSEIRTQIQILIIRNFVGLGEKADCIVIRD